MPHQATGHDALAKLHEQAERVNWTKDEFFTSCRTNFARRLRPSSAGQSFSNPNEAMLGSTNKPLRLSSVTLNCKNILLVTG